MIRLRTRASRKRREQERRGTAHKRNLSHGIPQKKPSAGTDRNSDSAPHREKPLHDDLRAHPGMDAALEVMGSPRQARDLKLAALQHSGDHNLRIGETVGALRDGVLSVVEAWDESP